MHAGQSAFAVFVAESTDVAQDSIPQKGAGRVAASHQEMRRLACACRGEVLVQALNGLADGRLEER